MTKTDEFDLSSSAMDLLAYWRECRGEDVLPHRTHIAPEKLRPWIGDLSVLHVHEGDRRFYVALQGANVIRHIGPGFNRQYLEDVIPTASVPLSLAPYLESIKRRVPVNCTMQPTLDNGLVSSLTRLVLPFWDTDPKIVSRFIVRVEPNDLSAAEEPLIYASERYGNDDAGAPLMFPIYDDFTGDGADYAKDLIRPQEKTASPSWPLKRFWPSFFGVLEQR